MTPEEDDIVSETRELIVLVDEDGTPIGTADKLASHDRNTPLHLAFSCYVFDDDDQCLITHRALSKKVWPGVWTNSVCGHPGPGEATVAAIRRRAGYELGMTVRDIQVILPRYRYRTADRGGIVENELCPVYVARACSAPQPNPVEVEAVRWSTWPEMLRDAGADHDGSWSWWCKDQLGLLSEHPALLRYLQAEPALHQH